MFTRNSILALAAAVAVVGSAVVGSAAFAQGVSLGNPVSLGGGATSTSIGTGGGFAGGVNTGGGFFGGTTFNNGFIAPSVVVPWYTGGVQSFYSDNYDYGGYQQPTQPIIEQVVPPHVVQPLIQEWNTPTKRKTHQRIIRGKSTVRHVQVHR